MDNVDDELDALLEGLRTAAREGAAPGPSLLRTAEGVRGALDRVRDESRDLASLYEVARGLAESSELSELLDSIIQKATCLVRAERGFVVLVQPSNGYNGHSAPRFDVAAARHYAPGDTDPSEDAFSSSLVTRVIRDREPVLTTNVQEDGRFELTQSIIMQQIRSVLAVPLVARGEVVGAVYVDTRMSERLFDESDLNLLQAMASQAAMAIRNTRLYQDARESNERLKAALEELRATQEQLVQAERLAAVGRLAASVAHELRNPLMVMRSSLFFLDRLISSGKEYSVDTLKRYYAKLDTEIDRQCKIINDLLFFSRNRPRSLTDVDLNALLMETLLRVPMPESVKVVQNLDDTLEPIRADGDQLQQVFVNLVSNAVQAMREGGTLSVTTSRDAVFAISEVSDTGVGIPAENLRRLFEPFYTTKENGIGLGLAVTRSIVEGHRGEIDVRSTPGEGTTFTVRLPFELLA